MEVADYQERASRHPGALVWWRVAAPETVFRILPDGCLDLIWVDGELLVAGPDTRPHLEVAAPGASYVGLRFAPGTGAHVLGVPAHELRDQRVPLNALWPGRRVRLLAESIGAAPERGVALERVVSDRLDQVGPPDPAVAAVLAGVRAGIGVAGTAREIGLSERQLLRRCLPAFGYGPKTLARVLRMRRALALTQAGTPLADVAARAGYADQAHLSREIRALAGVSPRALIR